MQLSRSNASDCRKIRGPSYYYPPSLISSSCIKMGAIISFSVSDTPPPAALVKEFFSRSISICSMDWLAGGSDEGGGRSSEPFNNFCCLLDCFPPPLILLGSKRQVLFIDRRQHANNQLPFLSLFFPLLPTYRYVRTDNHLYLTSIFFRPNAEASRIVRPLPLSRSGWYSLTVHTTYSSCK